MITILIDNFAMLDSVTVQKCHEIKNTSFLFLIYQINKVSFHCMLSRPYLIPSASQLDINGLVSVAFKANGTIGLSINLLPIFSDKVFKQSKNTPLSIGKSKNECG